MRENDVTECIEDFSDDEVLAYTQRARRRLIDDLVKGGMPDDPKDRTALLHALSDMDQTAINKKRLGAQQKTADADRMAALAIARVKRSLGDQNPFRADEERDRIIELDHTRLPEVNPVEGEMDIGISSENYDEFMSGYKD